MKGVIYGSGLIARNKREAIQFAKEQLDRELETNPDMEDPWVYVMHYNDLELIWFSVGYVERKNISNYIQLKRGVA